MATTKVAVPRPPLERPPERQRKRPGVRYVRREPLPPLESSKAHVATKITKDSTKQRSNGIRETESTAAARRRSKREALLEVQRVKRVNERKSGQSSKELSRPAEDRSVRHGRERESTPHQGHSTGSRPKKVSREDSSAATTTRRKSSEVESKQRKDRSTKGHLKELPQRKIYLDSDSLDDSHMTSSPSSSVLSEDSYSTASSYESLEKERMLHAEHKAEVERLLEEEKAFQRKYPALLEQLKRRQENVKAAEEASAKLESAYKKEIDFFTTQLEEVYKNTSVLVTTLQHVEKEKKKAEEMKREQENQKMMEMRKLMLKRILDEHLTHAHKDEEEDTESVACRDVEISSTSTQTNEVETPLQALVPTPPPQSTKTNAATPSHDLRVNSTCTQTDEVEMPLQSVVPCPPPLSTQPSFTRPSRYLRSKRKEETSQKAGSSAMIDENVEKVESPLKSQSTTHPQMSPVGHECSSVTFLCSEHMLKTLTDGNTDTVPHTESNLKATNSNEVSALGTSTVTKSELEKKLLQKFALFGQILQQEATHMGINNRHRLHTVQKLVSAIEEEMDTTASVSSKLAKDEQEKVSTPKALTSESETNSIQPQCSCSSKLSSMAQNIPTTEKVHASEETADPNTPLDLQQKSSSLIEEYIVELPAVTSPYSLHSGPVESIDASESNKSTKSALSDVQELASAMSSVIISEVLSNRSKKELRAANDSFVHDTKTSVTVVGDKPAMLSSSSLTRDVAPPAFRAKSHTTVEVSAENTEPNDVSDLQNEPQGDDEEYIVVLPAVTSPYSLHCGTAENIDVSQSNKSTESAQDLASTMSSAIVSEVLSKSSKKEFKAAHGVHANDTKTSTTAVGDKMKTFPSPALASDITSSSSLVQSQCKTSTEDSNPLDLQNEPLSTDEEYIVELPDVTSPYSLHCGTAENIDASQSNKTTEGGPSDVHELAAVVSSSIVSEVLSNQSRKDSRAAEGGNVNTSSSTAITGDEMTISPAINPSPASLQCVDLNVSSNTTPSSAKELATSGCPSIDCAVSVPASQKSKASSKASIKTQSTGSSVTIFPLVSRKEVNEPLPSGEVAANGPTNESDLVSVDTSKKSGVSASLTETNGDIDTNVTVESATSITEYQDTKVPYPLTNVTSSNIDAAESSGSTGSTITVLLSAESNISHVTVVLTAPSTECLSNSSALILCSDAEDAIANASIGSIEKVTTSPTIAYTDVGAVANSSNCGDDAQALPIGTDGTGEDQATQTSSSAPATDESVVLTDSGEDTTQTVTTARDVDSDCLGSSTKETGGETQATTSAMSAEETGASPDSGTAGDDTTQTVTSAMMGVNCSAEISTTSNVTSAVTAEVSGLLTDTNEIRKQTDALTTVDADTGALGENGGENSAQSDAFATVHVESGPLTSGCSHGEQNTNCSNCYSEGKTATSGGDVGESSTSELNREPKSGSASNQKICNSPHTASGISATNIVKTKSSGIRKCRTSSSAAVAASVNGTKEATESATSPQPNVELYVANSKAKSAETKMKSRTSSTSGTGSTVPPKSSRQYCSAGVRKAESEPSGSKLPSRVLKESKCKSLASLRTADMEEAGKPNKKRSRAAELGLTRPKSKPNMIPGGQKRSDPNVTTASHGKSDSMVLPKLNSKERDSGSREESEARTKATAVVKNSKETLSDRQSATRVTRSQSNRSHCRSSQEMKQGDISLPKLVTKTEHGDISQTNCISETQKSEDKLIHLPSTHSRSTERSTSHESTKRVAKNPSHKNPEDATAPKVSSTRVGTSTRSFRKYSKAVQRADASTGSSEPPNEILKKSKFSKSLASFRTSDMEQTAYPKQRRSRAAELGLTRAKSGPNMIPRGHKSSDSSHFQEIVSLKRCSKDSCCECNEMPEAKTSITAVKKSSRKTTAAAESKSAKTVTRSQSDRSHCRSSQSMKQKSKSFPEQGTILTK